MSKKDTPFKRIVPGGEENIANKPVDTQTSEI